MITCRLCHRELPKSAFPVLKGKRYERCFVCLDKFPPEYLMKRDKGICGICSHQVHMEDASTDHIIPVSKGGEHTEENVQLTHRKCNQRKGDKLDYEAQ